MVDPVKVVSDAEQAANQAVGEAKADVVDALSFGQRYWYLVAAGAAVLGFVIGKL